MDVGRGPEIAVSGLRSDRVKWTKSLQTGRPERADYIRDLFTRERFNIKREILIMWEIVKKYFGNEQLLFRE